MLQNLENSIRTSRKMKNPVIQKWERFEQHAFALTTIGIIGLAALFFLNVFVGQLIFFGGFLGLLICIAYYFMLATNITGAAVASFLVALFAATVPAMYITLPLLTIVLNGFGGTILVIGVIALWTRRL